MELITSTDVIRNLCKKMAPPLVTLLSAEPEIQYVALRNINLIVQKRPTILAHEIKVACPIEATNLCPIASLHFLIMHILFFRFSSASITTQFMLRWRSWRL